MTAFDRAIEAMFRNADMAREAVYLPPGEDAVPVPLVVVPLMQATEPGVARAVRNAMAFEVRVADLPAPEKDGVLTVGGVAWRLNERPAFADDERLTWRLEAFEA